jgi:hypothetical protein
MPRRRRAEIREILPDPVYNSTLVEKFVNSMMWMGKKNVAQGIFYESMEKIRERSDDDPLKLFKKAVENAKPRQLSGAGGGLAEPPHQSGAALDHRPGAIQAGEGDVRPAG